MLEERTLLTAYVVDTLVDTVAADGKVSLREAVFAANANVVASEAAAGQGGGVTDAIAFAAGVAGGTITLAGSELAISGHLLITGPVAVGGAGAVRIFSVAAAAVTFAGLAVARGGGVADGAGIHNSCRPALSGCLVYGNAAGLDAFSGNGGGVYNETRGVMSVTASSVSGNTARAGAGITDAFGAVAVVTGNVLAGNAVYQYGGGAGTGRAPRGRGAARRRGP